MRKKYICKYCESVTHNGGRVCSHCLEKLYLIRQSKAMLMPYYISKKEKEEMLGGSNGKSKKGV